MADPREPDRDETEDELNARLERLERELGDRVEKNRAEVEASDLFMNPPHPGPVPEVLQKPAYSPPPPPAKGGLGSLADAGAAWGVALDFLVTIGAGIGLGYGLDRWQGTGPWGVLMGMAVGFAGALYRIIRYTQRTERAEAAARARARGQS